MFSRWLPAIEQTSLVRKGVLGVAGLAFVGGAVAGPAVAAQAAPEHVASPVAAAVQADKPDHGKKDDSRKHDDRKDNDRKGDKGRDADHGKDRKDAKPGRDRLVPRGVQGEQQSIPVAGERAENVKAIVKATKKAGLDERAAVIAVGTSLQESKLENLGHLGDANDHDSLGLFQQRPSSGWGSPEQITDPEYSTIAFLKGLKQVDGWHDLPLTVAAQKVQVSAYPDAYAKWENQAADLVADHWNNS
ncbi:hypothetical protein [Plantactinospora sp. CA-290183]|uniref:hypothetical protein n=1 Tax=Plantactinospora sp. CA-290183 TaxID=3240006 RepID=UPI003D909BC7